MRHCLLELALSTRGMCIGGQARDDRKRFSFCKQTRVNLNSFAIHVQKFILEITSATAEHFGLEVWS